MEIRVNHSYGRNETRLALDGRFDAHEITRFTDVTQSFQTNLCLDFAAVPFIDSSGLSALVSLYRQWTQRGLQLRIVRVQDPVWLIFEITRLLSVLPIEQESDHFYTQGQLA